jgi:hypothetical protein
VIRIRADELHPLYVAADHVLDRVAAGSTNSYHLDDRTVRFGFENLKAHVCPPAVTSNINAKRAMSTTTQAMLRVRS